MTREIKFRALVENKLYYFTLEEIMEKAVTYQGSLFIELLKANKQQYTGLKDKNGKEIYEGDIIKTLFSHNGLYIVKFGNPEIDDGEGYSDMIQGYFIEYIEGTSENEVSSYWRLRHACDVEEVIGNIYENPELLEVNKNE